MRILVLNWLDRENPQAGGAELHLHETFGRLAKGGDDVTVLASAWADAPAQAELDGMRILRTGGRHSYALEGPRAARRLLGREPFDVVVEDLNKVPLFAPLWTRTPAVALVHHLFGSTAFVEASLPLATATWVWERPLPWVYRGRSVLAVSESTARDLEARGFDPTMITVIHNGVDTGFFHPGGERAPVPTVVSLGRLKRYKRTDLILDAVARLRTHGRAVRLIVAGEGGERSALEHQAARLGLQDAVEFAGAVSEEEKRRLLRAAWVHAVMSEKEGWGLTVMEAAACGTPCVAAAAPGLRESVEDGVTGRLVPPGDVGALSQALETVLSDQSLRERYARAARRRAEEFTWERCALRTRTALVSALERSIAHG